MNDEPERMQKQAIMTCFKILSQNLSARSGEEDKDSRGLDGWSNVETGTSRRWIDCAPTLAGNSVQLN